MHWCFTGDPGFKSQQRLYLSLSDSTRCLLLTTTTTTTANNIHSVPPTTRTGFGFWSDGSSSDDLSVFGAWCSTTVQMVSQMVDIYTMGPWEVTSVENTLSPWLVAHHLETSMCITTVSHPTENMNQRWNIRGLYFQTLHSFIHPFIHLLPLNPPQDCGRANRSSHRVRVGVNSTTITGWQRTSVHTHVCGQFRTGVSNSRIGGHVQPTDPLHLDLDEISTVIKMLR